MANVISACEFPCLKFIFFDFNIIIGIEGLDHFKTGKATLEQKVENYCSKGNERLTMETDVQKSNCRGL